MSATEVTPAERANSAGKATTVAGFCLDLDGTLYDRRSFWARMLWHLLYAVAAGRISLREVRVLYHVQRSVEAARHWGHRADLGSAIIEQAARAVGSTAEQASRLLVHWTERLQPEVLSRLADPSLKSLLTHLRLRGYRLGVYSDYAAGHKLEALGLSHALFDAVVESLSPEVEALKPHTRGFLEVCVQLGLHPAAVLYLGDRQATDGAGARAAGMPFLLCNYTNPLAKRAPVTRALRHWEKSAPVLPRAESEPTSAGCWVCGGSSAREYAPSRIPPQLDPDFVKITDARYGMTARLLQCSDCSFIRADADSAREIEQLYRGLVDEEYRASVAVRRYAFAEVLRLVRDQRPEATTLLDIGAGTGGLCAEAADIGFQAEGVEPSSWAVTEARQHGIRMHEGYFPHPEVNGRRFDIVTLCDVIEHVSHPVALLQAVRRCVAAEGLVVIVTPDIDSRAARLMGHRWWHFRVAHIGYFSARTMVSSLARAGLEVERIEPYVWRFPLGYLVQRLGSYLPIGGLVDRLGRMRRLGGLWNRSVRLNLMDSRIYFARPIRRGP